MNVSGIFMTLLPFSPSVSNLASEAPSGYIFDKQIAIIATRHGNRGVKQCVAGQVIGWTLRSRDTRTVVSIPSNNGPRRALTWIL